MTSGSRVIAGLRRSGLAVVPTTVQALLAGRRLRLPTTTNVATLMAAETQDLQQSWPSTVEDEFITAVTTAADQQAQRLSGLESKGFAAAALPSAEIATGVLLVNHNGWVTAFAIIGMVYALFALVSAALIAVPSPRASYTVRDACEPDWLLRLAAATNVNTVVGTSIQNRVYAAVVDTAFSGVAMIIAAVILFGLSL